VKSGNTNVMYTLNDSVMLDGRHMGYIKLEKFVDLAVQLPNHCFKSGDYSEEGDSIEFVIHDRCQFYGMDEGPWKAAYKNLPICITEKGFKAKFDIIDSDKYVYLPYQILFCVANNVTSPTNTIKKMERDGIDEKQRKKINLPPENASVGKKIQTEGLVLKNVTDILSKHKDLSGNRRKQLEALWRHVRSNWNYVNDPYSATDTWRSAYETIDNYYTVDGQCYSGDCDDFAILMASFARQVGFESRMRIAFNRQKKEGHAYAVFKEGDKWIPLDWFNNDFGGNPFDGEVIREYSDL
jgi:predicted transglutaminase-like cysteine proteinase